MSMEALEHVVKDLREGIRENKYVAKLLGSMFILCLIAVSVLIFHRCGQPAVEPTNEAPAGLCTDGRSVGASWKEACVEPQKGEKVWACQEAGKPSTILVDCQPAREECLKATFTDDVKPIVVASCATAGCHQNQGFENYSVASRYATEWYRRVALLPTFDPSHMPKNRELPDNEKKTFKAWLDGGLPNTRADCNNLPLPVSKEGVEPLLQKMNLDQAGMKEENRQEVRYCAVSVGKQEYQKKAIDKLLNSLNRETGLIAQSVFIDPEKQILRFDLRSFGLDRTDWLRIEGADDLNFVSRTAQGRFLQLTTKTFKPWLHCENLIDLVTYSVNNKDLYTEIMELPSDFNDLMDELGVQYEVDLRNGNAALIGMNSSVIAKNKNRLISRHRSDDGYCYVSYDTERLGNVEERNLTKFPLLRETGGDAVFADDAREVFCSLKNGFLMSALYSGQGDIQEIAPLAVVQNTRTLVRPDPEIQNPGSCMSCHAKGILPTIDKIRAPATGVGSSLNAADKERVEDLYRPQNSWDVIFKQDNVKVHQAMNAIGIDTSEPDPINAVRDEYLLNYDLAKAAKFYFYSPEVFKQKLAQSRVGVEQLGQLLTGGTVPYDQLKLVNKDLLKDFGLLEER